MFFTIMNPNNKTLRQENYQCSCEKEGYPFRYVMVSIMKLIINNKLSPSLIYNETQCEYEVLVHDKKCWKLNNPQKKDLRNARTDECKPMQNTNSTLRLQNCA